MPVIFLDIDGVLNRESEEGKRTVDTDLLDRFKDLVESTSSKVVLASTWRHDPLALAAARGFGIPFDDVVPDLRPRSRGCEVRSWLSIHGCDGRFVIIDDDDDGYEGLPLVQPNPHFGLTSTIAKAASDYLLGRRDSDYRRTVFVRALEGLKTMFGGHRG